MPELPEVEVTRRGIMPFVVGQTLTRMNVYQANMRWPILRQLPKLLAQQPLLDITRRGKYLLWHFPNGTMLVHLGMSGKLRLLEKISPRQTHDHVEWIFANGCVVRLNDPRRFGSVLWTTEDVEQHPLIAALGPEPLSRDFSVKYLMQQLRNKSQAIKPFLMDSHVVVGVGNIYATEALFKAGINPTLPAKALTLAQAQRLVPAIKKILRTAIRHGGTTIRDFLTSAGQPGYFSLHLAVYGRAGEPCLQCGTTIVGIRQAQRATAYCPKCQPYSLSPTLLVGERAG
jgi:formamidopyrimidine-DNA glycosylase